MIIWINGPFGAGKTTLAKRLRDRRSKSLIFDPEEIGFVVKETVPMPASGDYQDLPLWAYRKFKRPFRAVCWVGGGRASPVLGTDRTSVSGISASRGLAAALSAAMLR